MKFWALRIEENLILKHEIIAALSFIWINYIHKKNVTLLKKVVMMIGT